MSTQEAVGVDASVRPAAAAEGQAAQLPETVLIAEDEHLLARSLASDLEELGCKVIGPAPNGHAALELARVHRPDLALLDIRMPLQDGLAAAAEMYAQLQVPVVIISAYSDPPYIEASVRTGVFAYLLKPVTIDHLRTNLALAWGLYREHRQLLQESEEWKRQLAERKLIERGKGILMSRLALSEDQAMKALQRLARDSRRRMAEVAEEMIRSPEALLSQAQRAAAPSPPRR